jgi:rare lipoprotein A
MNEPTVWAAILAILVVASCAAVPRAPTPPPPSAMVGTASWYGEELRGSTMANGQPFDPDKATCATWHWPMGTTLRVTHGDRTVHVIVTDRGPSRRFPDRIVDLSHSAFARLAHPDLGLIEVTVTPLR